MTPQNDHNPLSDLLLESIRGELSPEEAACLSARLAADPELRRERDRLAAFLGAVATAHALPLDGRAGERAAARAVDRVEREESRAARGQRSSLAGGPLDGGRLAGGRLRRPVFWARLLAVSVAAHVIVLGFLGARKVSGPAAPDRESDRPFTSLAQGPEAPEEGAWVGTDVEDPAMAQAGPYAFDRDDPLPVEDLLTPGDRLPSTSRERFTSFAVGSARAMWVRTSDPMKRLIEARVGTPGTLERVQHGLVALAARQGPDGAFAERAPAAATAGSVSSVRATATVLLAFLGDGSSSRDGTHRDVVAKAIAWLRAQAPSTVDLADRSLACLALAEDFMLANGSMTPAESRARALELASLRTGIATAARSGTATPGAEAADRWAELAVAAVARAGVGPSVAAALRVHPSGDLPPSPAVEPRTAMLEGADLLRGGRGDAFATWNRATAKSLGAKLSGDGLVILDGTADLEETALVLLALQVAYRTY